MATTKSYRITRNDKLDSSSEEGELSSDDEIQVKLAVGAYQNNMETTRPETFQRQPSNGRKVKSIWTEVLADQSSNDISSTLGTVGMKSFMSRGPESFSIQSYSRYRDEEPSSSDGEAPQKMMRTETIEEEMENYVIERHFLSESKNTKPCPGAKLKRKRPKKVKPGVFPGSKPGQRLVLNKKLEISNHDSEERVAEELSFRLWEKKRDLIRALVRCIGVERALFLYNKTEMLELNGGLMTLQGNRRRTPGGTFLYLLRSDNEINQKEVEKIFEVDSIRDREQWKAMKEAKKMGKKQPSSDVGRTPHNSPQMDTDETKSLEKIEPLQGDAENEMEAIDEGPGESPTPM